MSLRHWIWIWIALLAFAGLAFFWSTGPYECTAPDPTTQRVTCK